MLYAMPVGGYNKDTYSDQTFAQFSYKGLSLADISALHGEPDYMTVGADDLRWFTKKGVIRYTNQWIHNNDCIWLPDKSMAIVLFVFGDNVAGFCAWKDFLPKHESVNSIT